MCVCVCVRSPFFRIIRARERASEIAKERVVYTFAVAAVHSTTWRYVYKVLMYSLA